ncbi:MAG: hypothetical protein ACMG57_05695, partial [Candidatus Dojkabacteria bacterium]
SVRDYLGSLYKNVNGGSGLLAILTGTSNAVLRLDDTQETMRFIVLTPPYLRRPLPEDVFGYFKTTSGAIFSLEIRGATSGDNIEFTCLNYCVYTSNKLIMSKLSYELHSLPVSEYTGFETAKGNFYFKYASNLQFRGLPINITVGDKNYSF